MDKKLSKKFWIYLVLIIIAFLILIGIKVIFLRVIICSPGVTETRSEAMDLEVVNQISQIKIYKKESYYGVVCAGEDGQEIRIGSGGRKKIICLIRTDSATDYDLTVKDIQSLKGASTETVNMWVLDAGWKGSVSPGADWTDAPVLILDIPRDAPTTTLELTIESIENRDNSTNKIHKSVVDITPLSLKEILEYKIC